MMRRGIYLVLCIGLGVFVQPLVSNGQTNTATKIARVSDSNGLSNPSILVVDSSGNSLVAQNDTLIKLEKTDRISWRRPIQGFIGALAVDQHGNALIGGTISGVNAVFGDVTLSVNDGSGFLSCISEDGKFIWTRQLAGGVEAIAVGKSNTITVAGVFRSEQAKFGGITLDRLGMRDIFVAQASLDGQFLWAKQAPLTGFADIVAIRGAEVASLAVDHDENVYITGSFSFDATFGETVLSCNSVRSVFLAKADPGGNWLYARQSSWAGGTPGNTQSGHRLAVDAHGNVYLAGQFWGAMNFLGRMLTSSLLESEVNTVNLFLAKINPEGDLIWMQQGGTNGVGAGVVPGGLAVTPNGDVYLAGSLTDIGVARFGEIAITGDWRFLKRSFATSLDSSGTFRWVETVNELSVHLSSLGFRRDGSLLFLGQSGIVYSIKPETASSVRPVLHNPSWTADGRFLFQVTGESNVRHRVEISSDLQRWSSLTNYVPTGVEHSLEDIGTAGQRFYRVIIE